MTPYLICFPNFIFLVQIKAGCHRFVRHATRVKHVHFPFPNSQNITYFPFQLVHCDLWTSPNESFTSYKYYLIVIDDFSCYVWTFPLCLKSDVPYIIHDFYHYALTQFHLSIQCVQCDNK
jgi:hypothetical protein